VFGLGGMVLPVDHVRPFASFFYRLKCNLLAFEIERAGVPAYLWEKKGASLYTTQNVLKYSELLGDKEGLNSQPPVLRG